MSGPVSRPPLAVHVRQAIVVVAVALVGALVAATVAGLADATKQRYVDAGYLRLVLDCIWTYFDRWGPAAAGLALLPVIVGAVFGVRIRPGPLVLRAVGVLLLLIGVIRAASALDGWRVSHGPNVLLISIDTLRADHLGTYGNELPTSPTIDRRLAGEGVTFEEVYSQSPKTTPSHMTMLTSLYPCVHGIELWDGETAGPVLNPGVHTLAEVLKEHGYATAAFTGGAHMHRSRGFDQGFDVYKHSEQLPRTREWISAHRRRKWFVLFHTYQVHDPYLPPADLIARFAPDYHGPMLETVERLRNNGGGWDRAHAEFWAPVDAGDPVTVDFLARLYDAGIRRMDEATIAPLLDLLDHLGLARDTLVVFTSDHGEAFAEHGKFLHDDLYAGTLHVPLILRWPGRLPASRRVATRARTLDLMPTILDLLGVPAPAAVQGRSLVPLVTADGPTTSAISEFNEVPGRVFESLRAGPLTLIVDRSTEQLFDLAHDAREQENVAAARPGDLETLRAELVRWRADCQAKATQLGPTDERVAPNDETRHRLRALGYVQ